VKTVDNHLMTVREKFKIDDTGICLSESYKRGLIKYYTAPGSARPGPSERQGRKVK
jgi:hypothetical protein